jgi:hypothetical protein
MKTSEDRQRRRRRAALLRNPPRFSNAKSMIAASIIMAELALIHKSTNHTGAVKHKLFMRGAKQLSELPQ